MRPFLLTALALLSFAANSIICRLALAAHDIDPATFTLVRLGSGALTLILIVSIRNRTLTGLFRPAAPAITGENSPKSAQARRSSLSSGNWVSAAMLFLYAAAFSFAYVGMKAGTGALILFGSVQVTMIASAIWARHRPTVYEWTGLGLALLGLIWLVAPGLSAPPFNRALLMAGAGIGWGVYSLRGRGASDPIDATAGNFALSLPFASVLLLFAVRASPLGFGWAALSGAVTSGCGYALWYAALPFLGATRAAIGQLIVPVIAAAAGTLFLSEPFTLRLAVSGVITLSGVAIALFGKHQLPR